MSTAASAPDNSAKPAPGTITIKSGVHTHKVPSDMTVGQIREKFGSLFKIPAEAKGYSGTQQLSDDQTLPSGSTLEFVRKSGEKGSGEKSL
jgi:hypothetical protein